jgi:hypothetical protein
MSPTVKKILMIGGAVVAGYVVYKAITKQATQPAQQPVQMIAPKGVVAAALQQRQVATGGMNLGSLG